MKALILKTVCLAGLLALSNVALAKEKESAKPDIASVSSHSSFYNNLIVNKGKTVVLMLNSGTVIKGKVTDLSKGLVQVQMLGQKSFYDSVVRIDDISAIQVKARK